MRDPDSDRLSSRLYQSTYRSIMFPNCHADILMMSMRKMIMSMRVQKGKDHLWTWLADDDDSDEKKDGCIKGLWVALE